MKIEKLVEEQPPTEKGRIDDINRLDAEVIEYFRKSLEGAILIGSLLHDQIGNLLPITGTGEVNLFDRRIKAWIKNNCSFNHRTALNYIYLHWQGQSLEKWLDSLTVFDLIVAYRLMMEHRKIFGGTFRKSGKATRTMKR